MAHACFRSYFRDLKTGDVRDVPGFEGKLKCVAEYNKEKDLLSINADLFLWEGSAAKDGPVGA